MNKYTIDLISWKVYLILEEQKSEPFIDPLLAPILDSSTTNIIDPELIGLIDRFFNLTYLNTIPMVNLLATAVIVLCIY